MACRVPYDVSGICSFKLIKLSGDVHPNPGLFRTGKKFPCGECQKSVRSNQDAILCAACDQWFHARCIGMAKQVFKYYIILSYYWCIVIFVFSVFVYLQFIFFFFISSGQS